MPYITLPALFAGPRKPTLTLERNGSFDVDASDISCKCGPVGADTITYQIKVECRDRLDPSGFLIDHNDLHAYMVRTFGGKQQVFPSCERMADRSARELWRLIRSHGAYPVRLRVTVAAFGMAGVTAKIGKDGDV